MNTIQQTNQGQTEQVPFGTVQHKLSDIMPTASEIGTLWESYMAESMSVCFLKDFVSHSKDPDIHSVLKRALDVSSQRVHTMEELFRSINHPIPLSFGEKDVDVNAKQLFSESFTLLYTRLMHRFVLINYCNALTSSYRSDFRDLFSECIKTSDEIHQTATNILLAKGILIKDPNIPIPDRVDFVQDKNYFGTAFGYQRPLNALEIGHIYSIMETKHLIRTLGLGYSQVVKSEKIRDFLTNAKHLAAKHLEVLGSFLLKEDIPVPMISEILVTDSKESPLSDKLILSHFIAVTAYIVTAFGLAVPNMSRKDVVMTLRGFITDVLLIVKDGGELMIEAGWLERIPETADRRYLTH